MALANIPTGNLPYVVVDELPQTGEEYTIYGINISEEEDFPIYDNYRYHNGEWQKVDLGAMIFGFAFADYQESVAETIADLEARVEALEDGAKVIFEGSNIELIEAGGTIGERFNVSTDIVVTNGTKFYCTLTDMTVDGEPIDDVSGEITASSVPSWDWQGGDLYSQVFGNDAYFAFGTEPKDAVATRVTLGFVNEGDGFPVRTLVIGHLKVEVI